MAAALGFRFLDAEYRELEPTLERLPELASIESPTDALPPVQVSVACDVKNRCSDPVVRSAFTVPRKACVTKRKRSTLGLEAAVARADLVLTGEGSLDRQTLEGKAPAGVAALARRLGRPIIAFGGRAEEAARADLRNCFDDSWRSPTWNRS
jgi:glycerate kinase